MFSKYKDFVPKSIFCLREGYSWNYFYNDLFAGISVGPSRHVNRSVIFGSMRDTTIEAIF